MARGNGVSSLRSNSGATETESSRKTTATVREVRSAPPTRSSLFSTLPSDLRNAIDFSPYKSESGRSSTIETTPQNNMAPRAASYQAPIVASSQNILFSFIAGSTPENLAQVTTATLHLTDVDLSSLLNQRFTDTRSELKAYDIYEKELARLDSALRALPGLQNLTIVPPVSMHSALLRGMYLSLLKLVAGRTNVRQLSIRDSDWVAQHVPTLKDIPSVTYSRAVASTANKDLSSTATRRPRPVWQQSKSV